MSIQNSINSDDSAQKRQERFVSHALVEVRKFKWLPFGVHSAVLLDISLQGFKLEFTGETISTIGEKYWLNIPLSPLGIFSPSHLICQTECRWFDQNRFRLGGVFVSLDKNQRLIIDQIINSLQDRGLNVL